MTAVVVTLEAAGTELHIVVNGRPFVVPVSEGYAQHRDVIDIGCDASLTIQELAGIYRAVECLGVSFDTAAYSGRF
jgi:hypothetical protein